ncbi:MAG: DNA polymerase IV [Candidatus Omnitrophica bacterium]|jgi:DNA polymerase-4|nr:DNA polymerase IV [Candidatus Omnitrophota bacterium]
MILHVDMDAFFASIEQAINPRLKGKPLIVGSRNSKMHTVVCAASYEAKRVGIGSGMSSAEAFKICPNLEFVAAEQSKYIWTSRQIFQLLKEFGFEVLYASIDEFQIDIRDTPNPKLLAEEIREKIFKEFNITASVGIAKNWLLAKLGSKLNKPNGVTVLTEGNLEGVLERFPAAKICGVGKSTAEFLDGLGVNTCLDLYQKSARFLEQNLGKYGINLYVSLHSTDSFDSPEVPEKPKSVGHSYTLPRAVLNPQFIKAWIRTLSEMVAQRLRQDNWESSTVHLWLNGPEIGNFGAQKAFQQPVNDGLEIYQRCLKIIAKLGPKLPLVRAIGVTCSGLSKSSYLQPLFKEQIRRGELLKAVDRINSRFGDNSIYPAVITLAR